MVTEFPLPSSPSNPAGITTGPDGAIWFTEHQGNRIGRIPTAILEIAVYRTSTGQWLIRRAADRSLILLAWGAPALGDVPVPADYQGTGTANIAIYRTSIPEACHTTMVPRAAELTAVATWDRYDLWRFLR